MTFKSRILFAIYPPSMFKELHCVALRTVKYNDRHSILTAFSSEMGRVSLLVPAGNGKSAKRYRALTMSMSVFECVAVIMPGREIYPFKDLKADDSTINGDFANPVRNMLAYFLSDFFNALLREPIPEPAMYKLLADTALLLWTLPPKQLANLHILTLVRGIDITGIMPDTTTMPTQGLFNMDDGVWQPYAHEGQNHLLGPKESVLASQLTRMNRHNFHLFRFTRAERNATLDKLLQYYALHGMEKTNFTTLEIVRDLF